MDEFNGEQSRNARTELSGLNRELKESARLGQKFASVMVNAFQGIALKGRGLGDVLRSLTLSLSQLVLKSALKPLQEGLGTVFSNIIGQVTGFSKGGVLQQAMPVPFAKGGVVASPITFPLAGGRTGLAGESGAEAILPLARGADGRLGVAAQGAGGGVNVVFNVTTPDAASFQRSESQIAAMLARAVGQGQRNL